MPKSKVSPKTFVSQDFSPLRKSVAFSPVIEESIVHPTIEEKVINPTQLDVSSDEIKTDDRINYVKYVAKPRQSDQLEQWPSGERTLMSQAESDLDKVEKLRIQILKARAEMWKYYISGITHTQTSDYELYSFL